MRPVEPQVPRLPLSRRLRRATIALLRQRRGMVSVEAGLMAIPIALIVLGMTDVVNLFRAHLRVESAALQLGQLVSQCNIISTPGDTDQFWVYAQRIIGNLGAVTGAGATGAVVVSAVGRVDNANQVAWQFRTGSSAHASEVGVAGGAATLAGGFQVPTGQTLFVTEVFLPRATWDTAVTHRLMDSPETRTLQGSTMFLTRAPDAPSLLLPPTASANPNCTGNGTASP
jgi:Flp pilus assembly protein TadG